MRTRWIAVTAGLGILVVAVFLILPYWFGRKTEEAFRAFLDGAAEDGQYTIRAGAYERGWFTSSLDVTVSHKALPVDLVTRHRVSHGPFPLPALLARRLAPVLAAVGSQVTFAAKPGRGSRAVELLEGLPPVDGFTIVRFDESSTTRLSAPASDFKTPGGSAVSFQGLSGEVRATGRGATAQVDLTVPEIRTTGEGDAYRIASLAAHSALARGPSGSYMGETRATAEVVTTEGLVVGLPMPGMGGAEGRVGFEAKGLDATLRTEESGGLLRFNQVVAFREVAAGGETLGPGSVSFDLGSLDAGAVRGLRRMLGRPGSPGLSGAEEAELRDVLGDLLGGKPTLAIQGGAKTSNGELSIRLKLAVEAMDGSRLAGPLALLNALSGDAELVVQRSVVEAYVRSQMEKEAALGAVAGSRAASPPAEEVSRRAARLAESMLLVPRGDIYSVQLRVDRGRFSLNGRPLGEGLGLLMGLGATGGAQAQDPCDTLYHALDADLADQLDGALSGGQSLCGCRTNDCVLDCMLRGRGQERNPLASDQPAYVSEGAIEPCQVRLAPYGRNGFMVAQALREPDGASATTRSFHITIE